MQRTNRHLLCALFIAPAIFFGYPSPAQKPEKTIAIATYRFIQLRDTAVPASLHTEFMNLYIGRHVSLYRYARSGEPDSTIIRRTASPVGESIEFNEDGIPPAFYFYPGAHRVIEDEKMNMFNYLFTIRYPDIDWQIGTDTMNIAGFHCQLAKGHWGGRTYTAWFCPDMPFRYGPWKLTGLPGLILQATDSTGQIAFLFERLISNHNPDLSIRLPVDHPVQLSEAEYNRLRKLFAENPRAYLESVFGSAAMSSMIIDPSFHDVKISNPIELTAVK